MITFPDVILSLGIFILIIRLPGLIWPKQYKSIFMSFIEMNNLIRLTGLIAFVVATVILYVLLKNMHIWEIILIILGFSWFAGGILIVFKPALYKKFSSLIVGESLLRFRVLMGMGALVGCFLICLGVFYKYFLS